MNHKNILGDHAVVIGGSIAGLLSAHILSQYFSKVTIVEKNKLPEDPNPRNGVPQSTQPHILLTKGYRILLEFFPELITQLLKRGALTIDWGQDFYCFAEFGWLAHTNGPSDLISLTCSRPLLEWGIRQEIQKNTQIKFLEEYQVTGLIYDEKLYKINGVKIRSNVSKDQKKLIAQLVVDCSGRNSKTPDWLKHIGLNRPPETIVNANLGYATRRYLQPKNFLAPWKVMSIYHVPPEHPRLGYLARIEKGEWIATLGGYEGDFPSTDESAFLKFASNLRSPSLYEAIKKAEPISPIYAYRVTANRLRHYEKCNLPSGFIVLGDAVCSLCPVYGQGMTLSALSSLVLQNWLRQSQKFIFAGKLSSSSFQKSLARSNQFHWSLATSQDSRFLKTKGRLKPTSFEKSIERYMRRLQVLVSRNPKIYRSIIEITHSIKSPLHFFSPELIWESIKKEAK